MPELFLHYSKHTGAWPWKSFTPAEVSCRHCGELYLDPHALDTLERLREAWGQPIILHSAHRCMFHNHAVGGAIKSMHLKIAFDCRCPKEKQQAFVKAAEKAGFSGVGTYPTKGFVHVDTGPRRSWVG